MKLHTFAVVVILLFALPSCSKDDYISLSVDQIEASVGGEEIEFKVSSNAHWVITIDARWATVEETEGDGDAVLTFLLRMQSGLSTLSL